MSVTWIERNGNAAAHKTETARKTNVYKERYKIKSLNGEGNISLADNSSNTLMADNFNHKKTIKSPIKVK